MQRRGDLAGRIWCPCQAFLFEGVSVLDEKGGRDLWEPPRDPVHGQVCALVEMEEQVSLGSARNWILPLTAPILPQFCAFQGRYHPGWCCSGLGSCMGRAVLPPRCSDGHEPTKLELLVNPWTLLPLDVTLGLPLRLSHTQPFQDSPIQLLPHHPAPWVKA